LSFHITAAGAVGMPWYGSHPYLNEFILENGCRRILEMGVYDGENARRMVEVALRDAAPDEVEYYGFDLFSYNSASRVERKLSETGCRYRLYRGNTLETLPEAVRALPRMDVIFIDGGKSYREAKSDWESSSLLMHEEDGRRDPQGQVRGRGFPRPVRGLGGSDQEKARRPARGSVVAMCGRSYSR